MDHETIYAAIRECWTRDTSADPDEWSEQNPARGQCDVTSLVLLEYLGGGLQLAKVSVGGVDTEHHYWNQLSPDVKVDLTEDQFRTGEVIAEPQLFSEEFIRTNYENTHADVRERHQLLRDAVASQLGVSGPRQPLGGKLLKT